MADSAAFDLVAAEIERGTTLSRQQARGALRMVLKHARFDAHAVNAGQMALVVERLLPEHLRCYGVADADAVCRAIAAALAGERFGSRSPESPDEVFDRLIRR